MTKWKQKTVTRRKVRRVVGPARVLMLCLLLISFLSVVGADVASPAIAAPEKKLKASDPYALIFGTVWGPDDRPVYGVRVKIRQEPKKKAGWEVYSDHSGEFAQRVAAGKGDYVVWADLKGVKTKEGHALHLAQEVSVHVEYDERVDIGLHLTE